MPVFCLALHAGYRCRHTGACCRTDWAIPAEPEVIRIVEAKGIRPSTAVGPLFVNDRAMGSTPVVARDGSHTCVFFDRHPRGSCSIHRRAGASALPSACRHFPREILVDGRGTFISLSHFCPTAAAMLFADSALDTVDAEPPLALESPVEGMDAVGALTPLVRPGLLSDLDGYDAWERACLATLARRDCAPQDALDLIAGATEDIREWRPGEGPLAARVHEAFRLTDAVPCHPFVGFAEICARHFPPSSGPVPHADRVWDWLVEPVMAEFEPAVRNYLGARVFGNWIAYQGRGLRTIVEWLRTVMAVFRNELARRCAASGSAPAAADVLEAIRATDLLLLHTVDSDVLARDFAALEGPEPV